MFLHIRFYGFYSYESEKNFIYSQKNKTHTKKPSSIKINLTKKRKNILSTRDIGTAWKVIDAGSGNRKEL